jgi:hypothetical protein
MMSKKTRPVDDLIEDMFGFSVKDEPETSVAAQEDQQEDQQENEPQEDQQEDEPHASQEGEPQAEGSTENAARVLQEAVKAHTGRRKSVDAWKGVAASVMGRKRLSAKLWQNVLDKGIELGLFEVDETSLSYPTLDPKDPTPEDPTPEEEEEFEEDDPLTFQKIERPRGLDIDTPIPENWNPPHHLDCGHLNWSSDAENEAARAEGFCCKGGQNKLPFSYQMLKGEFVRPVPKHLQRTVEKEQSMGYPGLCCDPETGLYIGGITNNCRRTNPEGPWCVVHQPKEKK